MNEKTSEGLIRAIGVRTLALNAVNLTVGAGIFTLPALVALQLPTTGFLAYGVCAALSTCVLLCFIESGSSVTHSGGLYVYIQSAFGPLVAFVISTLFWFGYCLMASAAVSNIVCDNLSIFFPLLQQPIIRIVFQALLFSAIAILNIRGVKQGARLMEILTYSKMLPLLILILVGAFFVEPENVAVREWPTFKSIGEVSLILFFAFGGIESSLTASGEIKNPRRTVPVGILSGIGIVFLFYVSIHMVAQGVLGDSLAIETKAPLAVVAGKIMGQAGTTLLVMGAVLSGIGLVSGDILTSSRLPYAAARDGLLPSFLAKVHPVFSTPYAAIGVYAGLGFLLAISGGFRQLAVLASAALLCVYLFVILATIKLRKTKPPGSFIIPGGLTIPIFALIATLWFLSNLAKQEIVLLAGFLVVCTIIYVVTTWIQRKKSK